MVQITCYDGVNCIGGNKILLEDGDSRLFFDFGRNFGAEGRYFEEYLQPKSCTGLFEHVQMGFLPPFRDLYRQDLVTGLCDPWQGLTTKNVGEVGGVLVSHAHVDHIGSIHHLRWDLPIYSSAVTAAMSRALEDTGASSALDDYCYCAPRVDDPEVGLASSNYRKSAAVVRPYRIVDGPCSDDFLAFWQTSANSRQLDPCDPGDGASCAGLRVRCFPVDHSVYGASAWAVETSAGWVVYSGDVRMHGGYGDYTRRFAEEAAKLDPIALILEGTRIMSSKSYTEADVMEACLREVQACKGLVIADFGARNVERLITFLQVARATNRTLAILPKDAYLLDAMRKAGGLQDVPSVDDPNIRVYVEYQTSNSQWRKNLLADYAHLLTDPREVAANQDKFICCFSFWDINELPYIRPVQGSLYIYSSCEAFNEEMAISVDRLQAWLDLFAVRRVGRLKYDEQEDDVFHVSGHGSRPDLMEIARTVRPKVLIPVHTEHPEVYTQELAGMCEVRIPERGVPVAL